MKKVGGEERTLPKINGSWEIQVQKEGTISYQGPGEEEEDVQSSPFPTLRFFRTHIGDGDKT